MGKYPEKTCSIDRLVTHTKLVEAAIAGKKTEQRRDGLYALPGEIFELQGIAFVITDVQRQRLGDMTDDHAKAEGYPSLDMYRNIILSMHAGMNWNPDALVWVHSFAIKQA